MRHSMLALIPALLLTACGGSYSDPGGGTETLYVSAEAFSDGTRDGTRILVEVRQSHSEGEQLTDAVVSITGIDGNEYGLPWTGFEWGTFKAGSYSVQDIQWEPGWTLEVKRGDDELHAYVAAPGLTTITSPIANTTFDRTAGEPLVIRWEDDAGRRAEHVRIDLREAADPPELDEDPRSYELAANRLEAGDERITLERWNEVALAGGTPGSKFVARTRHRIDLTVE